jgi:7-cyano-7-deazaguanine synthase
MVRKASPQRTVLLSGGTDSSALLGLCAEHEGHLDALFVDYGQPAAEPERNAAISIAESLGVALREVHADIGPVGSGEIPGRNALLVHLALATTTSTPATIFIGIHAGTSYRDCSPEFVQAMQISLDAHHGGAVQLSAPFISWSKANVYAYAKSLTIPLERTYSCEIGTSPPCGQCPSCQDQELLDVDART